jgi:hypothetical protein
MLIIRQEQIDTLIKGTDEEWVEFLLNHVKSEDPELQEKHSDDELRRMVKSGIKRSERHGMTSAENQSAFISVMFKIAPNFDEQPEIKEVLDDERYPPAHRLQNLWSPAVPDEAWDRALEARDEHAWQFGE